MYKLALSLSPDEVEDAARLAFVEMLEGGFTSVAEFHYLHHAPDGREYADIGEMAARLASAAADTGIELLLLPVFYAHAGFGGAAPAAEQRRFITTLDRYARLYQRCAELAPAGVAPHSLRAASIAEVNALAALAGPRPVHMHIAEQAAEVEACLEFCGQRPVQYLHANAPVGPNWCLVHATHITQNEAAALAATGATAGLCPITEANLGDGIFPSQHYAGAWGVGSDSNVLIDAARELQMLEYSQRLAQQSRNVLANAAMPDTATALYQTAIAGGAQAMGQPAGLRMGAPANFVTIAGNEPALALSQAVFCARAPAVQNVWVRGRHVVANGQHARAQQARDKFAAMVQRRI